MRADAHSFQTLGAPSPSPMPMPMPMPLTAGILIENDERHYVPAPDVIGSLTPKRAALTPTLSIRARMTESPDLPHAVVRVVPVHSLASKRRADGRTTQRALDVRASVVRRSFVGRQSDAYEDDIGCASGRGLGCGTLSC